MLRRFTLPLFHYEAVEDGGSGGFSEAADPGAPETPAPVSEDAGTAESAAPGWTGPSEDEWYETQTLLRSMAERLTPQQQQQALDQGATGFEWDPLAEDADQQLASLLSQRDEFLLNRMQEMLSPVVAHTREQLTEEAESRAMDVLADIEAQEGEFGGENGRQIARVLADTYFPKAQERYGNTPRAAEAALQQAAQALRSYERSVSERAVNQFKSSLQSVAGTPSEPGAETTAIGEVTGEAATESEAIARMFGTLVNT